MTTSQPPQRAALLFAAIILSGCAGGGDATAPPKPASVAAGSTAALTATVGTALATSPTFVVRDANGAGMAGVGVSVTVTSGGGSLSGAPTSTGSGGTASVGTWTLGTASGTNTLSVSVSGLATPLTITATGTPDVPTQLTVVSGNAQSAAAAASVGSAVTFKVGDKFNNGVAGVPVTFSIVAGGGALASTSVVTTDAGGLAPAPAWTLGKSTSAQQLRATAGSLTGTATATVATSYKLEVRFFGPAVDPALAAAFITAAERIQAIVTGDVPNIPLSALDISPCGITGVSPITETVDDLIVYATVAPGDGPFGVLGSAGICFNRLASEGGLALIGVMNFDSADLQRLLADGNLNALVLHEMLHTVGVGPLWAPKGQVSGSGTASVAFIGPQAVNGCILHGGTAALACGSGTVPLEATGGTGTANVHWRETTTATGIGFNTELMTGFIEAPGVVMPLSRMTIGSMQDIGYVVNMLAFDAYTVPSAIAASYARIMEEQGRGRMALNDTVIMPIGAVSRSGRVTYFTERP